MPTEADEIQTDTDAVRAGSTPNVTRWVLIFGLIGAVALLTIVWVTGAATSDHNNQTASAQIQASQQASGSDTDSIVGNHADQMNATTPGESSEPQNMPNKNAGQ